MLHEKQTDSFHWKNKLSDLDGLPEESISNRNAAWEKLHDRLHKKTDRNKTAWYWAAALLLLLFSISFLIVTNSSNNLHKSISLKRTGPAPAIKEQDKKDNQQAIIFIKLLDKQPATYIAGKNNVTRTGTVGRRIKKTDLPVIINSITPETAVVIITAPSISTADSAIPSIAMVPAKPSLRVVNINELDEPEALFTAQVKKHKRFIIQLGNEKASGKAMVFQRNFTESSQIKILLSN